MLAQYQGVVRKGRKMDAETGHSIYRWVFHSHFTDEQTEAWGVTTSSALQLTNGTAGI